MRVPESAWRSLREAMPSFAQRWEAYRDSYLHDAEEPFNSIAELMDHLIERVRIGDLSELRAFFEALESLFCRGDDDLDTLLRIGVLEYLQIESARHGVPINVFKSYLGPLSRVEWEAAGDYLAEQ
jgi:hypothetical protein